MARLSLDVRYDSVIFLEFLSMAMQRGSECALCALPVPVPESAAKAVGQVFRHRVLYLLATSHLTIMGGGNALFMEVPPSIRSGQPLGLQLQVCYV